MRPFDEMKAYVRFGADDVRRLEDLWTHVQPRGRELANIFYDRILEFDGARTVFDGPEQVARLKRTLQQWLEELLRGPHDDAYYERRRRIGEKHVAVGLPHRYMFTAMQVVQEQLCQIAHDALDEEEALEACASVRRATMLDLAIMTGTYMGAHERARLADMAAVMLAHLPSAACVVDRMGRVAGTTESARRLCGRDPVGLPVEEALPPALARATDLGARLREALGRNTPVEVARVDAELDGKVRSFRLAISPIEHEAFSAMVFLDEITASLEDEAARRRTEALVHMGSMSAAVAHELRNPLAGISGAVQVLAGSFAEDDRRRAIMGKVRDQIGRLDRMVRDLLAFSRPPEARLSKVRLEEVADMVCELARRDTDLVRVTRQGHGTALADADLVHRILLNLVQNGVSALEGRGGEVRLTVRDGAVVVSDDGPGIPGEVRDRVFEPFFTTKTTGTGLGLAICRNAADAMGATLRHVDGGPLSGASFELAFVETGFGG